MQCQRCLVRKSPSCLDDFFPNGSLFPPATPPGSVIFLSGSSHLPAVAALKPLASTIEKISFGWKAGGPVHIEKRGVLSPTVNSFCSFLRYQRGQLLLTSGQQSIPVATPTPVNSGSSHHESAAQFSLDYSPYTNPILPATRPLLRRPGPATARAKKKFDRSGALPFGSWVTGQPRRLGEPAGSARGQVLQAPVKNRSLPEEVFFRIFHCPYCCCSRWSGSLSPTTDTGY